MTTDHGDELGTDRSQRHWRLVTVQAGGGLTGAQARDGALVANVRKRMGPTLDGWVVRKRVRK